MGENLHGFLKREACPLSLSFSSPDNSSHIYPFSFHGMKSEDNISVCVFVWEAFLNNKPDSGCILTTKDVKPLFIYLFQ